MLQLRYKLFFGFGGLLLIILIVGIESISRITQLRGSIDVIIRENYHSIIACERMKESIERIDSGILFVLLGERGKGTELIDANLLEFRKALQAELDNITLPGEQERALRIRGVFGPYEKHVNRLLADRGMNFSSRRDLYFSRLLPAFESIKAGADEILHMNQQSMIDADERARTLAASARRRMYVLLLAGIVVGIGFMFLVGRWILKPISRLTRSAEEIRRGNLDLVVPVESRDEVGALSESFNEMAAALREFRRSDKAKVFHIQKATQAAFNSLPDAIAVVDLSGQVEVATGPAKEVFGLKPNAPLSMIPDGWITEIYQGTINTGHRTGGRGEHTIVQRFVEGFERYFRPHGIPILDHQGHPAGVVLLMQDVTLLRQQDEMKRGVISTVSHQLKTPLTSLQMALHLLLSDKVGELTPKQSELLVVARDESERLRVIIADLLDLSRIEAGKARMNFSASAPEAMIVDAVEPFRRTAQDQGLLLTVDVAPNLPEVMADGTQIGHVFANLLSNALKFTPPGGSIAVSAKENDDRVFFSVSDTGKGIPAAFIDKMFEKFVEIPGADTERGAGLGLAIVKEIIDAHGGDIELESTEGKGTTVTFSLPRADRTNKENSV